MIIVSAEYGKNYNIGLILLLIILGAVLVSYSLTGILFWILAAAYYTGSDKHKAKLIQIEENIYETYTNSNLASKLLKEFISELEKENKITQL